MTRDTERMTDDLATLSRQLGDRYVIERLVGQGGMGAVYLARDRNLDRPVALKVLPAMYAKEPELRERFLRETRLAAGFSHPNIVPVFSIEESEDLLAFAMGFVEGESVTSKVTREGPMTRRDAVRLLQDVGYALAYAHGRGVVHRDIKPDNIMIERATGRALVMDFGIARAITPVSDKPGLTRVGEVVGTPEYMSPEQATGDTIDGRADLYSLGLVAWFAMTGRTAMTGDSTQRILVRQLTEAVPSLAGLRPDLPAALTAVVDRCCAKEASDRFPTAEAMLETLDAAQLDTPEIPVAIRLLAPELNTIAVRTVITIALFAVGASMIVRSGNGNVLAVGIMVAATLWVKLVGSAREVRRLRSMGYTVAELQRLLALTLVEHDEERARRATDVVQVKRRRRRVLLAAALLLWQGSTLIVMRYNAGSDKTITLDSRAATFAFFSSLLALAVAITILLTSPFKRSFGERLFAAVWLGGFGRRLLSVVRGDSTAHQSALANTRQSISGAAVVPQSASGAAAIPHSAHSIANDTNGPPASPMVPSATLETLSREVATLKTRVDALETRAKP